MGCCVTKGVKTLKTHKIVGDQGTHLSTNKISSRSNTDSKTNGSKEPQHHHGKSSMRSGLFGREDPKKWKDYTIRVGIIDSYHDLQYSANVRPGWEYDSRGEFAYNIFLERETAMPLLDRIQRFPSTGKLPEPCIGYISRTDYRGYEVVVVRLTHAVGDKYVLESCAKKLMSCGPKEFGSTMAYYGTDPLRRMISRPEDDRAHSLLTT